MSRKIWIATGSIGVLSIVAGTGMAIGENNQQNTPGLYRDNTTNQSAQSARSTQSATSTPSAQTTVLSLIHI